MQVIVVVARRSMRCGLEFSSGRDVGRNFKMVVSCKRYNQRTIEAILPQDSHQSIAPPTDVHCLSVRTVWLRPSPAPPTLAYLMAIGYHESLSIEDTSPVGMADVDSFMSLLSVIGFDPMG
ncbi:hypothetical protein TNCV_3645021 [Trichonephila clavipes]|nr:hypothetical protein TNCV_3645021 [Trichonephila clavipes]